MDGRTVKEGAVERGARSAVIWTFRTTETSDEGPGSVSPCPRDEGAKGRSYVMRGGDVEREEASFPVGQVRRGMADDGRVGGWENENPMTGGLEGRVRTF